MQVFDNNAGLYFYSAIFQGNMALMAFAAIFVIFKLQVLSNALQAKEDQIIVLASELCARALGGVPEFFHDLLRDLNTFREKIDAKIQDDKKKPGYQPGLENALGEPILANYFKDRARIILTKQMLINEMAYPFLAIVFVVVMALILLPTAHFVHTKHQILVFYAIGGTVISNVIALAINVAFVFRVLSESPGRTPPIKTQAGARSPH